VHEQVDDGLEPGLGVEQCVARLAEPSSELFARELRHDGTCRAAEHDDRCGELSDGTDAAAFEHLPEQHTRDSYAHADERGDVQTNPQITATSTRLAGS